MPDDGFAALIAKLDALNHDALVAAERKALKQVGNLIKDALVESCPVQAGTTEGLLAPGELKDSFRASVHIASDQRAASGDTDRVTVQPNTKVTRDVAGWVEKGHAGPKPNSKRTRPHPFIRPTQDAIEQKAVDTYTATMTEEIKKVIHE